ncbi:RDD family protein [Dyella acidiphila]|uniref:RDD family protein n=1 Tax=Dyella acidiphila TaxID=2775866 RepID=A0ABR9G4F2_9GAMM|nr:RDD family protein [Dyella acidiphila]MBE1158893.1 RDD family protein [Dyella acidiphila]
MTEATTHDLICPLWRRLLALLYDVVAVLAIVMVVGLLCQLATHGQLITNGAQVRIAWWYQPLQALVVAAYFVVSWLRGGQTLGMRPWRIRVTNDHGAALTLRQTLVRVLVAALPLLLLLLAPAFGLRTALWAVACAWGLWFVAALFGSRGQAVHDLAAGSEVRRIG